MPARARTKERCVHLFELFPRIQVDADGWKQKKRTTVDEYVEEGNSGQGFGTDRTGTTKARKRLSHDEERADTGNESEDVPVKEKKPTKASKQNARRQTVPPQLAVPVATSGFYINNYGSGSVVSRDSGNITNSIISNVGNNNSRNYYQLRSKST